jgi:D-3-phosphoglycerate dehydrogenase / 2-oxoglutarate reductase
MMEVGVNSTIRHVYVIGPGYRDYATEAAILAPFGVEAIDAVAPDDPDFSAALARADAVLVREAKIDRSVIERLTRCKVITRYGIGVDNVDLEAARERRIYVANTPGYGIEEVSTHALALLLAVARRVPSRDRAVRAGGWSSGQDQLMHSLAGRTVGLVGYGRIARAFRKKLAPFAPKRTLVVDPYLAEDPPGVERVDIATLCAESDLISLHAPLTSETRHVIGAAELARMQPTTILVNTARGGPDRGGGARRRPPERAHLRRRSRRLRAGAAADRPPAVDARQRRPHRSHGLVLGGVRARTADARQPGGRPRLLGTAAELVGQPVVGPPPIPRRARRGRRPMRVRP